MSVVSLNKLKKNEIKTKIVDKEVVSLENSPAARNTFLREVRDIALEIGKMIAITGAKYYAAKKVQYLAKFGICFENIIPSSMNSFLDKSVSVIAFPTKKIAEMMHLNSTQKGVMIAPVVEEIEFRYFLQQFLFTSVPQNFFDKFFPNLHIDLQSTTAKTMRVALTAFLFALAHLAQGQCDYGGGLSQFLGGLFYSYLIENDGSIFQTMGMHALFNQIAYILK